MAGPLIDTKAGTAVGGLAADSHSLDKLRHAADQDPAKAVKEVSKQFEALFMQQVLKSMRAASPKGGMFDSNEQDTYTSMLDEQLAQKIAQGGTGLASVIERQLSRNLPQAAASLSGTGKAADGSAHGSQTSASHAAATNGATAMAGANAASVAATGAATKSAVGTAPGAASARRASSPSSVLENIRAAACVRSAK
jgi:flagellar protein FlgJ